MEKFEITKEQILQLHSNSKAGYDKLVSADLKNWFLKAFETKLEVGMWYKLKGTKCIVCYQGRPSNSYGFDKFGLWGQSISAWDSNDFTLSTTEEVEAALIAEAKKRGFKEGVYYSSLKDASVKLANSDMFDFDEEENKLLFNNWRIFKDGVWAEIIPTMTKEQAEKELNCKII